MVNMKCKCAQFATINSNNNNNVCNVMGFYWHRNENFRDAAVGRTPRKVFTDFNTEMTITTGSLQQLHGLVSLSQRLCV